MAGSKNRKSIGNGKAGPGRKKGSENRVTACVKDNILRVFENMGGMEQMTRWAKKNQTEFYKFYARLAPREVEATVRHISSRDGLLAEAQSLGIPNPEAILNGDGSADRTIN